MARMSCFSILLTGRRQKRVQVGDAGKDAGTGSERQMVKPVAVESTDALPAVAAAVVEKCGDKIVADVVIVVAHKGASEVSPARSDSLSDDIDFEFHPQHKSVAVGSDVQGPEKHAAGTVPDAPVIASAGEEAAAAEVEVDPSAKLKRSCSNIETKRHGPREVPGTRVRSRSYGDLPGDLFMVTTTRRAHEASPDASVKTSRTADGVMLKRRSSSQVLPSRSRKLWWRLFLWSHRNLHRPWSARPSDADAGTPRGGYTSDTLEEPADRKNKKPMVDESPPQPPSQNQWVAFCADHSLSDRVSDWVSSIDNSGCLRIAEEHNNGGDHGMDLTDDSVARPRPIEAGESSGKGHGRAKRCAAADDVAQANSIVQSLNGFSSVAHISGMGLKVVPMIAPFSNLRAVNLSGNFIVHISPGSLPKGLHSLDLSRNKIANVEGLRELTKLRVLNLSYNRISRIGHGLSNCTAIRELHLAGNKIGDVEGLHRLLRLAVLDLGFNRLTTAKALGQLVANYHSLLALNLVGNPVQANVGDDALRKAVTDLLPQLAYLNKQPLKPRETATDSVARAALGTGGRRRGASRRLSQSPGSSSSSSSRSRSKGRQHHGSSMTARK
ncbi:uncharacterized protein LOC119312506 isoform X1 [Triticum dicoccoides]|uniref:uncharacterized protein LOC119312506 isoform X1 n=2 Tax=Triticum dicoccoides TaxID=85692 RepID=UPI00189162CE|nr:uncharacterized protein LOC119312506 isoform X1 [Triticum dicoccoides]XP_037444136.1 uncharacterized protein LOC119312506 isoform X1 [Triticum dicoccoides]XP_037444137.1 uncharacterized protein LOC119312506 isoform X1 [Triticum dicoccoides]